MAGDTLNVPDSITGLTILAAGTSLPEAVSSVLVTVQGKVPNIRFTFAYSTSLCKSESNVI